MKFTSSAIATIALSLTVRGQSQPRKGLRGGDYDSNEQRFLAADGDRCIAAVASVDDGVDPTGELLCEMPDGKTYQLTGPGITQAWIKKGRHRVALKSGHRTELQLPVHAIFDHATGVVSVSSPPAIIEKSRNDGRSGRRLALTGVKKILVVRIMTPDRRVADSEQELSDTLFGTSGNPQTAKSQYFDCSHGQLYLDFADDRDKVLGGVDSTNIRNGVTTVNLDDLTYDNFQKLLLEQESKYGFSNPQPIVENRIVDAINIQFGVNNPNELADNVLYVVPQGFFGTAYGTVNGWKSVYPDYYFRLIHVVIHELGHNFGLQHSGNEAWEYGDRSDFMGRATGPKACFNGAKMFQLGWFNGDDVMQVEEADLPIVTDLESFVHPLSPDDGIPKVIKINRASDSDLYIVFNWASGHNVDAGVSSFVDISNTITIVEQGGEGATTAKSVIHAALKGEEESREYTYTNYFSSGKDLLVKVTKKDTVTGMAVVTIMDPAQSSLSDPAQCSNSEKWNFVAEVEPNFWTALYCDDVATNPTEYCEGRDLYDYHYRHGWEACPLSCPEDLDWLIQLDNGVHRSCDWIQEDPENRCELFGINGVMADEACPIACCNVDIYHPLFG